MGRVPKDSSSGTRPTRVFEVGIRLVVVRSDLAEASTSGTGLLVALTPVWLRARVVHPGPTGPHAPRAPALLPWRFHGRNSPEEERTPMRRYEIMVILDPNLDERTVAPSLENFLGVVRNDGGSVEKTEIWGKRRLAYEIEKNSEGIYAVIDLTAKPETVKELDRQLGLAEAVLRTKVLRPEVH